MATVAFTLKQEWQVDAASLWAALSDWPSHSDWIPATRVRIISGDGGLGTRFVARTGIGPIGFDDHMTVVEFDAATTHAVVEKTGPLLLGSAGFRIEPRVGGCQLLWFETIEVPHLPRVFAPLAALVGRALFVRSLDALRRRLEPIH